MGLSPAEIRHIPLGRGFGYRRGAVEELIEDISASFEDCWRERADLADRVEHLEEELQRHRDLETLLRRTLISAEAAAEEQREAARRDAELVVAEAYAEARRITFAAAAEHERLMGEVRRVRALLGTALSTVEELDRTNEAAAA